MTTMKTWTFGFLVLLVALAGGYMLLSRGSNAMSPRPSSPRRLKLATTTSTENSGLLHELLPPFEEELEVRVDVIAVGTGKALKLGENGDVDVVLVHAPEADKAFVDAGFGIDRRTIMYNDFVIVGPRDDPAGIGAMASAVDAFRTIVRQGQVFVSRGDESGTHKKEKKLWRQARGAPQGQRYLETGQGMGATLVVADEKQACTVTDRATFLTFAHKLELVILCEGDRELHNPYSVIAVNPARHPHVNYADAAALIKWICSPRGQRLIVNFRKEGEGLFHPSAPAGIGDGSAREL